MSIYFNGCSATFGHGLEDPAAEAWPVLVASALEQDFLNDAVQGGTNTRTVSRTVHHLNNFDYFCIQWTYTTRFTLYDPTNQWEVNFHQGLSLSNDHYKNQDKFKTFGKYYFTYWNNFYVNYINWLNQIILLQSLFKANNKKYLMLIGPSDVSAPFPYNLTSIPRDQFTNVIQEKIDITHLSDEHLSKMQDTIDNLLSMIDKSVFLDRGEYSIRTETATKNFFWDLHCDKESHQGTAQRVLEHINQTT